MFYKIYLALWMNQDYIPGRAKGLSTSSEDQDQLWSPSILMFSGH
jgi:hypothetical protein